MSLSSRDKRRKKEITISNFYAKQVINDPAFPFYPKSGFFGMVIYVSKKITGTR